MIRGLIFDFDGLLIDSEAPDYQAWSEVVAFEDSISGSLAAKRAGIFCVAIPNAFMRADNFEHVDLRLGSLADVPLAQLLDRVAAQQEMAIQ